MGGEPEINGQGVGEAVFPYVGYPMVLSSVGDASPLMNSLLCERYSIVATQPASQIRWTPWTSLSLLLQKLLRPALPLAPWMRKIPSTFVQMP